MKSKSNSRRNFLSKSLTASAIIPFLGSPLTSFGNTFNIKNSESLNILILGGTSFLGPHQIAYALKRGHSISIFTRGKTKSTVHQNLFSKVEHLMGDRENDLSALKGRKWDVVIDNSGRKVQWTKDTAELLKDNVNLYLYTSSTGVYYPYLEPNIKEDRKVLLEVPKKATDEEKYEYDYGVMKANSELVATKIFGENRTIIVRPTYMMGPGDKTDRFTHWPVRLQKGGDILIPGKPNDPVQYIDVRDVAEWMIRLIETKTTGIFNAAGPASKTGMHQFVYGAHAAFNSKVNFISIPNYNFLSENEVFFAVPWIPPTGKQACSALTNIEKSVQNGLTFKPLSTSCKDIVEWWNTDVISQKQRNNLENGQYSLMRVEKELLKKWEVFNDNNQ